MKIGAVTAHSYRIRTLKGTDVEMMDSSSLNTIIGIIAGIVSILTGVVALMQASKKKHEAESGPVPEPARPRKTVAPQKSENTASPVTKSKPATIKQEGLIKFVDDDAGYRKWIENNPQGFVVNTPRTPNPQYMALHRATCGHVSNFATREPGAFTERDYIKICSADVGHLGEWAKAHGRTDGSFTGNCNCKPVAQ